MSNVLTPNAKQQFFDNNGRPAVGYQLFTYAAGTTTKLDTYVSESGAANTNPIVLDYRGECNLWIPPNVSYKYVLAPPSDTDPPTASIWTVDDVVSSQLITLYGGVDTGSVNAYVLNFDANFNAYTDGTVIYWLPTNTNTGPSTLNVNGLGAIAIVDQNGDPLVAGAITAGQIANVIYLSGEWQLLATSIVAAGSFTGTLTGFGSAVTGTVYYRVVGGIVTLWTLADITGTSNSTSMTMTGLPVVVRPGGAFRTVLCAVTDNTQAEMCGMAIVAASGSITFRIAKTDAIANYVQYIAAGFTAGGTKGIDSTWMISYPKVV